jgi:hypothetical protein
MRAENRKDTGCPAEDRLEADGKSGARSAAPLKPAETDGAGALLAKALERENLNRAYLRVKRNGGAPGVDGMTTGELLDWLREHKDELVTSIEEGRYKPKPVRRVEMPKPDGGKRDLGIPTVVDRVIQLAIEQILEPLFEPEFSDSSYGFRPGRSAQQAIEKAREYCADGYKTVVDIGEVFRRHQPRFAHQHAEGEGTRREADRPDPEVSEERRDGVWSQDAGGSWRDTGKPAVAAACEYLSDAV